MDVAVGFEGRRGVGIEAHLSEMLIPDLWVLGVARGFGSTLQGEPTATLALATVREYLRRGLRIGALGPRHSARTLRAQLMAAFEHANVRLFGLSGSDDDFVGSGTSMTLALIAGDRALLAHVGDGRGYLFRKGLVEMLSSDDALVLDPVASAHGSGTTIGRPRSLLWRSLGTQAKVEVGIVAVDLASDDLLMLCTEGIYRSVASSALRDSLSLTTTAASGVARVMAQVRATTQVGSGTMVLARRCPTAETSRPRWMSRMWLKIAFVVALIAAAVGGALFSGPLGLPGDRTPIHTDSPSR